MDPFQMGDRDHATFETGSQLSQLHTAGTGLGTTLASVVPPIADALH